MAAASQFDGQSRRSGFLVAGVPRSHGRFTLAVGKTYTIEARLPTATKAPRYVYPAPEAGRPYPVGPAMTKIGPHMWVIPVTVTTAMDRKYRNWNLGILSGRILHIIRIRLRR